MSTPPLTSDAIANPEGQHVKRSDSSAIWTRVSALIATGLLALLSFSHLFTTFAPWDDEGYFLIAFRDFLFGRVLYDQVFAMYGPVTFWTAAVVARFAPGNVTHDAFRWVLLPLWIATAALLAGTVWRWTRRSSLSLVVFLLIGSHLEGLAKGVGHPQCWIVLAGALLLYIGIDWISVPDKQWQAFLTGSLVAFILLCKINLGIFATLGIALALSVHLRGWLRTFALWTLGLSAASFGILIFLRATIIAERCFALAFLGSLASVVGIAIHQPVNRPFQLRALISFLTGLGVCFFAAIGLTLALGTTASGLLRGLITEPAHLVKNYHYPFWQAAKTGSILLSAIAVAVAAAVFRKRRTLQERPVSLATLKVCVGVALLCLFCFNNRLTLTGSLLFLFLLVIDAPPLTNEAYSNRFLLASLSLLFSLQLFPMAGEQADWATLLPMVAAAVILADGLDCIERQSSTMHLPRWSSVLARSTLLVLGAYLFLSVGTNAVTRYRQWQTTQSLDLPGAHWLRLPADETARLRDSVFLLHQNCNKVLTIPGMYSFSLWSGVSPIEDKQFNSWPFLWADEVENKELPKLRQSDRGCVLLSESAYLFFKHFAITKGNDELLSDVRQTMPPIATVQDLTLYRASQNKTDNPSPTN